MDSAVQGVMIMGMMGNLKSSKLEYTRIGRVEICGVLHETILAK